MAVHAALQVVTEGVPQQSVCPCYQFLEDGGCQRKAMTTFDRLLNLFVSIVKMPACIRPFTFGECKNIQLVERVNHVVLEAITTCGYQAPG